MALESVDKRFALIAENNEALYPYKKSQLKTVVVKYFRTPR